MAEIRALLIDDDSRIAELLKSFLHQNGVLVEHASDGQSGLRRLESSSFDLVLLDVMMPGIDGLQALRLIRAASSVPVLMLTAKGDDGDRILGLEEGADDYVPKPCTPRELAARLRAILKRVGQREAMPAERVEIRVGDIVVRPAERRAERRGQTLEFTSTEFSLFELLARHAGRVVSKEELSREALGRPLSLFDRSIDVHMSSIRQKLGALPDGRSCIQTVIRKGYQLIA